MRKIVYCIALGFLFLVLQSANKDRNKALDEIYRPQFHFTPEKNWMGNPNGLIWIDGVYHMFYQHNPLDTVWGFIHWGHAKSKDLVNWEHLPVAIKPDNNSSDKEIATAWSGSAIIDKNNAAGLQKGTEPTALIFYNSRKVGQCLAYSNDDGMTWEKYDKNPIIPYDANDEARDPKVFWYEPGNKYIMMLCRKHEDVQGFSFYSSSDLKDWKFESHLSGFYEHPDMVQLPVLGKEPERKWVVFDCDGSYCVGNFDGKTFVPETTTRKGDYGTNYYGTQTWSNIPAADGRVIQIAWMEGGEYPEMPFVGQMTFPCELALMGEGNDMRLIRKPVKEIGLLHKKKVYSAVNKRIIPGLNKNPVKGIKGDCLHIVGTFDLSTVGSFGFMVRMSQDLVGTDISYDAMKNTLSCMGLLVTLPPENGKITLEILIDRTSIEVFANGGKMVMSGCFTPYEKDNQIYLYNIGGELIIEKLEIFTMKSIYETNK